jgi:hypothetical protein
MPLTKKDFEAVADALARNAQPHPAYLAAVKATALGLRNTNPRFDSAHFVRAVEDRAAQMSKQRELPLPVEN